MRACILALLLSLSVLVFLGLPRVARAEVDAELGFTAGAAWALPTGGAIGDAYDGGPLARIGLVLRGAARFQGLLTAGYYRETARPDRPVFAQDVDSRIRWIPVSLEGRLVLREWARSPYVSVGVEIWQLSESFGYRLAGENRETEGNRTTLGGILGFGIELTDAPLPIRLGGRLELSSLERKRLTADGSVFDTGENALSTFFSIGIEVER